ncbi:sensor histidine kinase [Bailinhaonella thermotolerans]|uniref:histidine kinase n=2 Tax=Bailinhaonella thermotolerans TaxID=1070861 RepID=A0A3A4AYX9_9ACTN|nr:sensor histidine kinase [Bailinhaonella thermotolerans]
MARRAYAVTGWPWRALAYLLTTGIPMAGAVLLLAPAAAVWAFVPSAGPGIGERVALAVLGAALPAVAAPPLAPALARLERLRLRLVDSRPLGPAFRAPAAPGLAAWARARYADGAAWRALAYLLLLVTVVAPAGLALLTFLLTVAGLLVSPFLSYGDGERLALGFAEVSGRGQAVPYAVLGVVLLAAVPYLLGLAAGAQGALARTLLGPGGRLRAELVEVARSRARLVDAFEAERRRIERDLHDGAQQRLLSLSLRLGLARHALDAGSEAGRTVAEAHEEAKLLMAELRELVRGIHPRVLTDRGLAAALEELGDRCPLPVTVRADLAVRPPAGVESAAYFAVAEALNNAVKHSGARAVLITARLARGILVVEVTDDGRGGAEPGRGSGLTGLADRVAVVDGRMFLSSPAGGPTVVRVELPCPSE